MENGPSKEKNKDFGILVRRLREERGLDIGELAARVSKSKQHLYAIEAGGSCSLDVLRALVRELRLTRRERLRLVGAAIGETKNAKPVPYSCGNVAALVDAALEASGECVSQAELERILAIQSQFPAVLSVETIRALLLECRAHPTQT